MRKRRTDDDIARRRRLKYLEAHPLRVGDKVRYRGLVGVVLEAWGAFYACRNCTKLLPGEDSECCWERVRGKWQPIRARLIQGQGIFEVEFEDGDRALNHWWLEKV